MALQDVAQRVASGDNVVSHVVTAGAFGGALSGVAVWILQLCHLDPPASVDQSLTIICIVAASVIMKRLGQ